ncbi:hypothetical protein TRFO_33810 [Tritrichomonas foetus]|uniref:Uncharacterized protein n=1 Tax=Tritrichomonas foetus TaxID=1144522 RepID=A0A1J4JM11_9EUKA|nr:hypothetical protein TRFO_33810 [Tritrichomonas foetus]|eukprot:OHS99729.1 hypothetical protein TRFO_33810 [Tritrichomonas foetus]
MSNSQRAYLSSLRDLQGGDAEENLKKKREQQIAFAESLRRQIEEKQQRKKMEQNQQSVSNQLSSPISKQIVINESKPHFTFGEQENKIVMFNKTQKARAASSLLTEPPDFSFVSNFDIDNLTSNLASTTTKRKNEVKKPRKQILTKADLSQFDHFSAMNSKNVSSQIHINSDSPFASSTVPTPPQGFSMRSAQPKVTSHNLVNSNFSENSSLHKSDFSDAFNALSNLSPNSTIKTNTMNNPSVLNTLNSLSSSNYFQNESLVSNENFLNYNIKNHANSQNDKNYRHPQTRAKSMLSNPINPMKTINNNMQLLGSESELVYPDGHLSPAVSPRDVLF